MEAAPQVIVLAGANGSGKTTSSRKLLAETLIVMPFVNADMIAQGLAGFNPESTAIAAGRIMLERLRELAEHRENFAFETTLAARSYAGWLKTLRESGYHVRLLYFWLESPDLAVARVAQRVAAGGHHVPEATIRQRYKRSVRNFLTLYRSIVDVWQIHDNSLQNQLNLVAEATETGEHVYDEVRWDLFQRSGADE
jgi:predicted ABC-type ATPase